MPSPKKIRRWNRFEIAFAEGKRPDAAALRRDWREKLNKKGSLDELGKASEAKQGNAKESDAKTFAEKAAFPKRSPVDVSNFWEQARRAKVAAEAKKRSESALKAARSVKSGKLAKSARAGKSPLEAKEFPFPRRPRTFRSSEPARRFDRLRRDQEEGGQD